MHNLKLSHAPPPKTKNAAAAGRLRRRRSVPSTDGLTGYPKSAGGGLGAELQRLFADKMKSRGLPGIGELAIALWAQLSGRHPTTDGKHHMTHKHRRHPLTAPIIDTLPGHRLSRGLRHRVSQLLRAKNAYGFLSGFDLRFHGLNK